MPLSTPSARHRACALLLAVALLAAGCGSGAAIPVADAGNLLPTADAGPNTVGRANVQVTLDGSASRDPEGQAVSFRWVQTEGPLALLSSLTHAQPTFTPTVPGVYVFSLEVQDSAGMGSSPPSTVTVVVIDDLAAQPRRAPGAVARAGGLRSAAFLKSAPTSTPTVVLADGSLRTVFVVDVASDLLDDPPGGSVAGLLRIDVVVGPAVFVTLYAELQPGDEDPDHLLWPDGTQESLVRFGVAGQSFVLDGSRSTDDGVIKSFTWTQVGGPFKFTTEDGLVDAVVPVAGTYVFELTVTDNINLGGFTRRLVVPVVPAHPGVGPPAARAAFVAGTIPDADPETPETAAAGATVVLTGASSSSRNGGALTFAWKQLEGPLAAMAGGTSPLVSVVPLVPGAYAFGLTVTDANGVADSQVLHLTVAPAGRPAPTPVLLPIPDAFLAAGGVVIVLDGATSSGDGALTYRWQQTQGVPVFIENAASGRGSVVPPQAGLYEFELRVTDANGLSAPVRRSFRVH